MKVYIFEHTVREDVYAHNEKEARTRLEEQGYIEEEFELVDVVDEPEIML